MRYCPLGYPETEGPSRFPPQTLSELPESKGEPPIANVILNILITIYRARKICRRDGNASPGAGTVAHEPRSAS